MLALLLLACLAPLALIPVVALAGPRLRARTGWLALAAPLASTAALLGLLHSHTEWGRTVVSLPWIPSLGLDLVFLVDGLSLFFALIVSGAGTLVVLYATAYLDDHHEQHGRFYASLLLFMAAMLGTVLAGNLLLLLVCWEATGIASFLLIGFLHRKESSREGARTALVVTAGTGLVMLAGVALVGVGAGTLDLATLLDRGMGDASPAVTTAAFLLLAVGAFGKSAQFPFHFWLPGAMAAPTPVSAYLHSATMVKLGVFLVARVFPIFHESALWGPVLVTVCFGTMLLGAAFALVAHDLKAILAWSTVSQLGALIGGYGLAGGGGGAQYDLLHIANHVLYKGGLFMIAGIVDHATGVRDVRQLGGLARRMPVVAVAAIITTASMAGVFGTTGFLSKETMLKETLAGWTEHGSWLAGWALACVVLASLAKVAFSVRLVAGTFFGPEPEAVARHYHAPGPLLQLAPAVLALATLALGLAPGTLEAGLAAFHTPGLHATAGGEGLHLWPGLKPEFLLGTAILVAGVGLYFGLRRAGQARFALPRALDFERGFVAMMHALPHGAQRLTAALRADQPIAYLPMVLLFLVALVGGGLWSARDQLPALPADLGQLDALRSFVVVLVIVAVALVLWLRRWTAQLVALSVIGFMITFYFVLFRAPDLAMTQILVESATLLLVLLLLSRFPRTAEQGEQRRQPRGSRLLGWSRAALAAGAGALAFVLTLLGTATEPPSRAGHYYLEQTLPAAEGANAVNTILVDFRGTDTLMEITVLVVAALGGLGLLLRYRRTPEEYAAGAHGPAGYGLGTPADPGKEGGDARR